MKAMRDWVDEELVVINLFASNYARDLMYIIKNDNPEQDTFVLIVTLNSIITNNKVL